LKPQHLSSSIKIRWYVGNLAAGESDSCAVRSSKMKSLHIHLNIQYIYARKSWKFDKNYVYLFLI